MIRYLVKMEYIEGLQYPCLVFLGLGKEEYEEINNIQQDRHTKYKRDQYKRKFERSHRF